MRTVEVEQSTLSLLLPHARHHHHSVTVTELRLVLIASTFGGVCEDDPRACVCVLSCCVVCSVGLMSQTAAAADRGVCGDTGGSQICRFRPELGV